MKINIFPYMKPCRITDVLNELVRVDTSAIAEDRIEDWGGNEFNEINSLDDSTVNQEV